MRTLCHIWLFPDIPHGPATLRHPQLYQALNMRVVLVGLEMWDRLDAFHVSPEAERTLDALLGWRAHHLLGKQPHDNVQLIT